MFPRIPPRIPLGLPLEFYDRITPEIPSVRSPGISLEIHPAIFPGFPLEIIPGILFSFPTENKVHRDKLERVGQI